MKKLELISGKSANNFDPKATTTRAEAITVLLKMLEQEVSKGQIEEVIPVAAIVTAGGITSFSREMLIRDSNDWEI